jgi:hypothetical protein
MNIIDYIAELGSIVEQMVSIYSECVLDSSVEELVSDLEIEASAMSLSTIKPHVNDESDKNYENAIARIGMCAEKAKPLLNRLGKVDLVNPLTKVGELTSKSVFDFSEEIYTLNTYIGLANRLIRNKPIDSSRRNAVMLLQTLKQSCNTIIVAINEVISEHNDYFKDAKSMQVNYVDLIVWR